jgi:hypothetical protein
MSITKAERLAKIHAEALQQFDVCEEAGREERLQALADRRFYSISGAQWEGNFLEQFENRPRLEVNKVHKGVMRIINEYRNNRISVEYIPKDGAEADELAETCNGLYLADEKDSNAEEAQDNAFEEAAGGGFGAWRLKTEYEDEYDEDGSDQQRIRFEPIFDADSSVFFDLNAKRQDKSDAMYCFVLTSMTPQAYEAEYDDSPSTWNKSIHMIEFDWMSPKVVYVAEYYKVEITKQTIHIYKSPDGVTEERYSDDDLEDEDTVMMITATGLVKIGEKKIKKRRVHKYILSGNKVLEDAGYIAGPNIPVIPVFGKRWYVDNRERFMGAVRLSKDAQRLKNMQLSRLAEISAMSPIRTPIFAPEQVAGHELRWSEMNVKNYPFMLVNLITQADGSELPGGPLGYTEPPDVPAPLGALLQLTEQDMQDLLGQNQAAEEMQPNISGRAIELIQTRLDQNNFIYMSNMAKAVKRCGEIWLGMAKEVYVEDGRKMKTVSQNGETGTVSLAEPTIDPETTRTVYANDLSRAKFDTVVTVGPTSESKRSATVRSLVGMLQFAADPDTQTVLTSMAMMNMEGEGLKDTRQYFRKKLVRMGAVEPTEEEMQEMQAEIEAQGQQPDANEELLLAEAEKSRSVALLNAAKIQETAAKTAKTMADIDNDDKSIALNAMKQFAGTAGPSNPASGSNA